MKSMTRLSKFSTLSVLIVAGTFISACTEEPAPEVDATDEELVMGREVYVNNCASCHGSMGEGRTGTQLNEGKVVEAYPVESDQLSLIKNGVNSMPAFGDRLSEEQLEAVTRYTREGL